MAAGPLLISEPLQRYRALGMAGDPVWRAAGQLRTAIAARLSRKHADLLAIPEVDPTGQRIDWYAPFEGEARKLSDLSEAERAPLLDEVHRLHGDIAGLADSMEAPQRSSAERNFARLLRHALTAPGEDALYIVDGKPVMTFWGFSADAALPGVFLASPPVAPRPARGDSRGRSRLGARRRRRRYTLGVVAVGSAGRAAAAHAGAARLAGAALPAASRTLSRSRSARPCAEPCRAPAARAAADARQHAAAGQRKPAARTRPPDRRAVTPRRRLRGRHRRPGRHDRGRREWPADRTRRGARHAARRRRQRGRQGRGQGPGQGSRQGPRRQECRQGQRQGTRSARQDHPRTRARTRTRPPPPRTSPSRWSCRPRPSRSRTSPS